MKKVVILSTGFLFVLLACGKNKFNTRPSLTLKSLSSTNLPVNGDLRIDFEFTDKEGDISDSIFLKRIRTNQIQVPVNLDTFGLAVPSFPEKPKGEITLLLNYQLHIIAALNPPLEGNPPTPVPDTIIFKIALRDKAGNISDTVTTEPIIVAR